MFPGSVSMAQYKCTIFKTIRSQSKVFPQHIVNCFSDRLIKVFFSLADNGLVKKPLIQCPKKTVNLRRRDSLHAIVDKVRF